MRVSHFLESEENIIGGIKESAKNQRKALEIADIEYTADPDLNADILHIHSIGPKSLYYALKAKKEDISVVINVHTTAEDFQESFRLSNYISPVLKKYLKLFYSQADLLITPSEYTKNLLLEKYDLREDHITTISNGVDAQKLEDHISLDKSGLEKYDVDSTIVFCVGSVFERKGVSDFVEIAKAFPELTFIWFGKIFEEKILDKKAREAIKNPPENVEFTGFIEDICEAYAAGDIFLYPTHTENQGIPALEAAYCEKPILLRDIEPFKQDFRHRENCLKGENNEELEEQLATIIEDKELREKISGNARNTVKEHTIREISEKLRNAYESLDRETEPQKKVLAKNQN